MATFNFRALMITIKFRKIAVSTQFLHCIEITALCAPPCFAVAAEIQAALFSYNADVHVRFYDVCSS